MTYTETSVCETCGHHFRSDAHVPQPSFNPERTQMLTLPPTMAQAAPPQIQPHEPVMFIEPAPRSRRAKVPTAAILVFIMLTLVLLAGFYVLIH